METPNRALGHARARWHQIRPLVGDKLAPVFVLVGASTSAGFAEAGVLLLVSEAAALMVTHGHQVSTSLGPVRLRGRVGLLLVLALGLACARLVLQLIVAWLPARISASVQARLRRDLFDAFARASWSVQADEPEGQLQDLMTDQIGQATQAVLSISNATSAAAMFLALMSSAFALNIFAALVVLASAVALFGLLRPLNRFGRLAARDMSQATLDHAMAVSESVRLAEETQVFGATLALRRRIGALIETTSGAFFRWQLSGRLIQAMYQSLVMLLIVGGLAGLFVLGARNLAGLGAVVLMLVRASTYGQQFQGSYHSLNQMLPYLDRLDAALARYRAAALPEDGRPLPAIETLAFDDVSFAYRSGRPVLRRISFAVTAGEAIGIVGPSGAGKSTLVHLLLRLREPDTGRYLVNGESATTFARADWRQRVAYVAQEGHIMQGTVADNIRYFRDLNDAAIERAARLAHIHDEIISMAHGYDTVVGQRTDAVSGGQRQRLCIARALAAQPDILILDEPTSALDLPSEAAVQASLAELLGEVTLFVVAHRLSTLRLCHRVLVLADGALEGFATAAELEQTNAFYRRSVALSGQEASEDGDLLASLRSVASTNRSLGEGGAHQADRERLPPRQRGAGR